MDRSRLSVVSATLEHAELMSQHLRAADVREMWAQAAWSPHDATTFSFQSSRESYSVMCDDSDVPILMFGICNPRSHIDGRQVIWLLATDRAEEIKKPFLKECAQYMNLMAAGSNVYNYVMADNFASLRWLKWLGFSIMAAEPHGWLKKPFHYVEKVIPCVSQQQQRPS